MKIPQKISSHHSVNVGGDCGEGDHQPIWQADDVSAPVAEALPGAPPVGAGGLGDGDLPLADGNGVAAAVRGGNSKNLVLPEVHCGYQNAVAVDFRPVRRRFSQAQQRRRSQAQNQQQEDRDDPEPCFHSIGSFPRKLAFSRTVYQISMEKARMILDFWLPGW